MKIKRNIVSFTLIGLLFLCMSGCDDHYDDKYDAYFENKPYEYIETLDIESDHIFQYEGSKEILNLDKDQIFTIYVDKEFTMQYFPNIEVDKKTKELTIKPNTIFYHSNKIMNNKLRWGFYEEYFLVQNYDLETGKEFDIKPVSVFTLKQPLDTPSVTYAYQEDELVLSWNEIRGAKKYQVVCLDVYNRERVDIQVLEEVDGDITSIALKESLPSYIQSEDEQYASNDAYWWENEELIKYQGRMYGVIAKNGDDYSSLGNIQNFNPKNNSCDFATFAQQEIAYTNHYESIDELPSTILVSNCEGNTMYQPPQLQIDDVVEKDGNLHIPFLIKNSRMKDEFVVHTYDENYKEELTKLQARIKQEYKQLENKEYEYQSKKTVAFNTIVSTSLPVIEDSLYLNDENGEYIAKNMVVGANVIDLSKDQKLRNSKNYNYTYIYDLIEEIQHQNPIILKTLWYEVDFDKEVLYVHYLFDDETRKAKQEALRTKVKEVNAQILHEHMSDMEKVYAINDYICEQTMYHEEAAQSIDETGKMNPMYFDANLATGVFTNGQAVCEGYASAFMLLARDAALESIMVSGYRKDELDVRHAWNRVNIEGNWYVVDVTFNDQEDIYNSILLLPDTMSDLLYQDDEYYVIDTKLDSYHATKEGYEYYAANDLLATYDNAANILLTQIQNGQDAIVRLPIETTDVQYEAIVKTIVDTLNRGAQYHMFNGVLRVYLY